MADAFVRNGGLMPFVLCLARAAQTQWSVPAPVPWLPQGGGGREGTHTDTGRLSQAQVVSLRSRRGWRWRCIARYIHKPQPPTDNRLPATVDRQPTTS